MNNDVIEQRNRYAMVGVLMAVISVLFLIYMTSSLIGSTKKYMGQMQRVEITCR